MILLVVCCCWLLLVVVGCFWLLLVVVGCFCCLLFYSVFLMAVAVARRARKDLKAGLVSLVDLIFLLNHVFVVVIPIIVIKTTATIRGHFLKQQHSMLHCLKCCGQVLICVFVASVDDYILWASRNDSIFVIIGLFSLPPDADWRFDHHRDVICCRCVNACWQCGI